MAVGNMGMKSANADSSSTVLSLTGQNCRNPKNPMLFVIHEGRVMTYSLTGRQIFGRSTDDFVPDIYVSVKARTVSRRHGVFETSGGRISYTDTGSKNGTSLNDQPLKTGAASGLEDGSVLRIHALNSSRTEHDVVMVTAMDCPVGISWRCLRLDTEIRSLEVGRSQAISLKGSTVSRRHATFFHAENGWAIIDDHSLNGVFLNGHRIKEPVLLRPMDVIWIARHIFIFLGESILYQQDAADDIKGSEKAEKKEGSGAGFMIAGGLEFSEEKPLKAADEADAAIISSGRAVLPKKAVSAPEDPANVLKSRIPAGKRRKQARGERALSIQIVERNVWNRLRKKTILKDISLQIESGSLVLILGGSGAGKTTFMNAVMGYEPAKGRIVYGNNDIYREYEKMKYEIGYVPQQDLLRMEDVVFDTLDNAAQMRLPDSLSAQQREMRVQQTLEMFGLSREKNSLVGKLSGGQRKRLSIAVEYIGNPSLFFLDEPDSGLDGVMAKDLMGSLRQIADQGKIVMVISHSPDRAFDLFDRVIVLAKCSEDDSGRLIYYGAPAEACRFFETSTLEGIVGRINRKDEGGEGLADYFLNKAKRR